MAMLGLTSAAAGTEFVATKELHVDPANITTHPLFEDADEEYAELLGPNGALRHLVAGVEIKRLWIRYAHPHNLALI